MNMTIDVTRPIEVHMACCRVLTETFGKDVTRAFVRQCGGGEGDYTKEKQDAPPQNFDEYTRELLEFSAKRHATTCASTANTPGRDFTTDRHNFPELSNEEIISGMRKIQDAAAYA